MPPLAEFAQIAHAAGVPVIVDAASEYDLTGMLAAGADLALYSSHKFLGGPTGGIVAGRRDLVRAAFLQNGGIGRGMKVGKEGIAGDHRGAGSLGAARPCRRPRARDARRCSCGATRCRAGPASPPPSFPTRPTTRSTGCRWPSSPPPRTSPPGTWRTGSPPASRPVIVRDHEIEHGYFQMDPCNLHPGEETIVAAQARRGTGPGARLERDHRNLSVRPPRPARARPPGLAGLTPLMAPADLNARLDQFYAAPQTRVKVSRRRRLNLLIAGEGEPTVIFAPGGWASTLEWAQVQHPVAARTRTVAYDNAGFGFSDPGPLPRTASAIVNDLRAALKAADIPPPYVLAGWSFGGLVMRLFAFNHPQDVVGMVMVDSSSERQISLFASDAMATAWRRKLLRVEQLARAGDLVAGTPEYDAFVVRDGAPKLPAAVKAARRAQRTSSGFYRAARSEYANLAAASLDEMNAARRSLGDMPLIVLTAGEFFPMPEEFAHPAETWREAWRTGHDEIAALSTRGERRTIAAGHAIQWEKPKAVITAIEEVLALARTGRP